MPRLIFKKGKVEYSIPHGILRQLIELGKESRISGLEKGTELCSVPKRKHPIEITGIGRVCTGDSCSIEIEDCGETPSIGGFHTHPVSEGYLRKPQLASFADLLYLLWKAKYTAGHGLGCRIGITPSGLSPIRCDKVKVIPSDEEMQALEEKFDEYANQPGEEVMDKKRYFYPAQEIKIDGKIKEEYKYKLDRASPLFSKYPESEFEWMNTKYFLRKIADNEEIELIKNLDKALIEEIKIKIKKKQRLEPLVMVIAGMSYTDYYEEYAPEEVKYKIDEELKKYPPSHVEDIIQALDTTVIDTTENIVFKVVDYKGVLKALAAESLGVVRVPVIVVFGSAENETKNEKI